METKPIIALYKAYRGGEWFQASLESIRPFVDGIVIIFSDFPWNCGGALPNNCQKPFLRFWNNNPDFQIFYKTLNSDKQEDQYDLGLSMIHTFFGKNVHVLLVDTDEIWDSVNLKKLCNIVRKTPATIYFSGIYDYVKSPLFRIPASSVHAVALGSPVLRIPYKGRFCPMAACKPLNLPRIRFHHFTYVRADESEVKSKMSIIESQDGTYVPGWFEKTWPYIPRVKNFHPSPGYGYVWPFVEKIAINALPPTIMQCEESRKVVEKYR